VKRIALGFLLSAVFCVSAQAQSYIRITTCGTATPSPGSSQGYMDATGNVCTSAVAGTGAATNPTAGAAVPSYSAGTNPFSMNLSGGLRVQQSLGGTDLSAGQQLMAASMPVVIASNQTAISTTASSLTLVALDVSTVTTGGTAVVALTAGHRNKGGWLQNPVGATIALCVNEIGTASGTTSAGSTTCIQPGQSYSLTPSTAAVSVISSDSTHPFSGVGIN
jgi:hypothetical protein